MAWQPRPGGHYYYRSIRVNGRVRSVYIGTGAKAEAVIAEAKRQQEQRQAERRTRRQHCEQLRAQTAQPEQITTLAGVLAHASLLLGGYFQHDHGEWRTRHVRQAT